VQSSARWSCWVDYQDMTIVHHVQLFHNVSRAHYWYKVLFLNYFFLFCAKRGTIRSRPGSNVVRLVTSTHSLCVPSTTTYFLSVLASRNLWFLAGLKYFILFGLNIWVLYRKLERSYTDTKNYKLPLSKINLFERRTQVSKELKDLFHDRQNFMWLILYFIFILMIIFCAIS